MSAAPARAHLWVLLPLLGVIPTAVAWHSSPAGPRRGELAAAVRWQLIAGSVVVLHVVLQAGVELARWMHEVSPPSALDRIAGPAFLLMTVLNLGALVAEWGACVAWGLAAARGAPYPGSGGE